MRRTTAHVTLEEVSAARIIPAVLLASTAGAGLYLWTRSHAPAAKAKPTEPAAPPDAGQEPPPDPDGPATCAIRHVVQRGERLDDIATLHWRRLYDREPTREETDAMRTIIAANSGVTCGGDGIKFRCDIQPGQVLFLPCGPR